MRLGWYYAGWMVNKLGYHDAYAGVIHAASGGFALGILSVLGPRIGKFRNGKVSYKSSKSMASHNWHIFDLYWFLGFYAACNVPYMISEVISGADKVFLNKYLFDALR